MISQSNKSGLRNPWLLGLLGLIVLVLAVNATFIWLATHNRSTLVDREYKTKDRKTNAEFLSELGTHQALAWRTAIRKPKLLALNAPALYEISVADRDGKPVSGEMTVEAYRGADAGKDFTTSFKEVSAGNYQGYITFPLKGYWELHIHVTRGKDEFTVDTQRFAVADAP
ncbi:MAG: FixH family protein [Betaproteobacteria bacterium]|nr:FixH family protein [Rhodocyclales bacterium]